MENYPSFMTCILRTDISVDRWQKTIAKILKNVNVANFRMNTDGTVEISGTVHPKKFLKILKKARSKAELCHFQFGECSTNLFLPPRSIDYGIITNKYGGGPNNMLISSFVGQKEDQPGYYGGRDGRFLHYGDKPSQSKKSKISSKEKSHRDHDHDHNHNHIHGRDQNHNHVHGRDYDHNHNHIHGHNHNHNHNHIHDHDHDHGHNKERKLEHAAGCINATTPRPKVKLDCVKGRAKPLQSQGVNSCCLM